MAILTAPLLSFGASGQIAKAAVYMHWKGLNTVRKWVSPANPKSTAQLAQRSHLTWSMTNFHSQNYTDADMIAWNRYAGTLEKIMSGFNAFMRLKIEASILGVAFSIISDVQVDTPTNVGFDVDVENSLVGITLRACIGTRRTFFPVQVALVDDADNTYSLTWAAGASEVDYYVKIEQQIGGIWYQRTGIFHVKTS